MKITPFRRTGKTARKRKGTRGIPKIRWERLGLQEPTSTAGTRSMTDIRREISSMASRGLEPGIASHSRTNNVDSGPGTKGRQSLRKRRRGGLN